MRVSRYFRPRGGRTSRRVQVAALLAATAMLAGACGGGEGSEASDKFPKLYEAAKKEGTLNLYSHVTDSEQIEGVVDAFKEAYPDIDVEVTNKTGSAILETFLSEKRANVNTADVIQYPGIAPFEGTFRDEKFIQPFTPSSADQFAKDSVVEGYAYPWLNYTMGAIYNTDKITDSELECLRKLECWADPRWKGRISGGSPGSASIQRALYQWVEKDENLGDQWLKDYAALDPVTFNSVTPAAERVIAGEYVASFPQMSITAARAAPDGAPIGFAAQEYSVANPALIGLASKAEHPNAGKLFIEWLLSKEGQKVMIDHVATDSLNQGMEQKSPVTDEDWFDEPKKLVVPDDLEFEKHSKSVTDKWNKLIGPAKE